MVDVTHFENKIVHGLDKITEIEKTYDRKLT